MQKDKFLILTIIILFVMNIFTLGYVLFGRQNMPPPFPPGPHMMDRPGPDKPDEMIIHKLNLNEQQIKQFDELKKEHRNQVESLQETSRKLHDELFGLLKESSVDVNKKNVLIEQISENQKELDNATFQHFEKLRGILSEEQKKQFSQFIDEIARSFKQKPPR